MSHLQFLSITTVYFNIQQSDACLSNWVYLLVNIPHTVEPNILQSDTYQTMVICMGNHISLNLIYSSQLLVCQTVSPRICLAGRGERASTNLPYYSYVNNALPCSACIPDNSFKFILEKTMFLINTNFIDRQSAL